MTAAEYVSTEDINRRRAIQGSYCHHTSRTQSYLFPSRPVPHRNSSNNNVRVRVFIVVHRYLATVAKRPPPRLKSPTSQCSMIFVSYIIFSFLLCFLSLHSSQFPLIKVSFYCWRISTTRNKIQFITQCCTI